MTTLQMFTAQLFALLTDGLLLAVGFGGWSLWQRRRASKGRRVASAVAAPLTLPSEYRRRELLRDLDQALSIAAHAEMLVQASKDPQLSVIELADRSYADALRIDAELRALEREIQDKGQAQAVFPNDVAA